MPCTVRHSAGHMVEDKSHHCSLAVEDLEGETNIKQWAMHN